jgi:hypothetical protein
MRVIYVSRCKVCPCLVTTSCGVRCFYAPPTSSILGDLSAISPDCPLAEMPTAEQGDSAPKAPNKQSDAICPHCRSVDIWLSQFGNSKYCKSCHVVWSN